MSTVDIKKLNKEEKDKMVCTYAALMLHDGDVAISEDKLAKVIKASGNAVEGYWPGLFAKALAGQDIAALMANMGGSAAAPAAAGAADAAPAKKEEKVVEEEEADVDMGGLFGDDY
jgi:large subunit ribosomal protein LP1